MLFDKGIITVIFKDIFPCTSVYTIADIPERKNDKSLLINGTHKNSFPPIESNFCGYLSFWYINELLFLPKLITSRIVSFRFLVRIYLSFMCRKRTILTDAG